jgi:hypothetical protein
MNPTQPLQNESTSCADAKQWFDLDPEVIPNLDKLIEDGALAGSIYLE